MGSNQKSQNQEKKVALHTISRSARGLFCRIGASGSYNSESTKCKCLPVKIYSNQ